MQKNTFEIEGTVVNIGTVLTGASRNTGKKWRRLEVLVSQQEVTYIVIFWNEKAQEAINTLRLGNVVVLGGYITARNYKKDNKTFYYVDLCAQTITQIIEPPVTAADLPF